MEKQLSLKSPTQKKITRYFVHSAIKNNLIRNSVIYLIQKKMYNTLVKKNRGKFPAQVQQDKIDMAKALFQSINRNIKKKLYSKKWLDKFIDVHINNLENRKEIVSQAKKRIGFEPPLFITISPTKKCNLRCDGCYACSSADMEEKLTWETFDRILTEKRELWGSYFTVISGGEPFLWEDNGKNFLDMIEKHYNQFFMVYTNGTLITKAMAARMAELGNITPAISVEGYEKETDRRRGKGIYNKILQAFENLREAGVPFGVSITASSQNWDLVSTEDFFDFWFNKQGTTYGWIFQYMPIGDRSTFDLVVRPEQRLEMLKRTWKAVREEKLFLADFWNSGTATSGCIAGGRPGGYFYITWSGDITPCVFVPYSDANIYQIYQRGGTLDDAILTPMMKRIRDWQATYGFTLYHDQHTDCQTQNWLAPCFIRDHFDQFLETASNCVPKPIDAGAEAAIDSNGYHHKMLKYGDDINLVCTPYWDNFYLKEDIKKN